MVHESLEAFALKHTSVAERAIARHYLALLANARTDSVIALLAPEVSADTVRGVLPKVPAVLASAPLDSLRLIGVNINQTVGTRSHLLNLSYEGPTYDGSAWVVCNVAMRSAGDTIVVIGFSAYPMSRSLESQHAFTLGQRSVRHYLWFVLALLVPVCTISVAVLVMRAHMPRRWLWAFVSLVATPAFALNWTTGRLSTQVTLFLLFGGSAFRSGTAAPWIISFGVPTGALIAYLRLRAWRDKATPTPASSGVAA